MIFKIVELLAQSPIWVGLCGFGVVVVPILGIQHLYSKTDKEGG